MRTGVKWRFNTKHFLIVFSIKRDRGYRYNGEDPDGETQAKLDSGEYVAFDSEVEVFFKPTGEVIGRDTLGGSVYADGTEQEFWTAHRGPDPANRNTLAMRATNRCIGHYFPDMVSEAVREAREHIAMTNYPRMRKV